MNSARPMAFGTGNVIQMKSSAPNAASIQYARFFATVSRRAAQDEERDRRQPEEAGALADVAEDLWKRIAGRRLSQNEKKCENRAVK